VAAEVGLTKSGVNTVENAAEHRIKVHYRYVIHPANRHRWSASIGAVQNSNSNAVIAFININVFAIRTNFNMVPRPEDIDKTAMIGITVLESPL
jgi:hypothetical protein